MSSVLKSISSVFSALISTSTSNRATASACHSCAEFAKMTKPSAKSRSTRRIFHNTISHSSAGSFNFRKTCSSAMLNNCAGRLHPWTILHPILKEGKRFLFINTSQNDSPYNTILKYLTIFGQSFLLRIWTTVWIGGKSLMRCFGLFFYRPFFLVAFSYSTLVCAYKEFNHEMHWYSDQIHKCAIRRNFPIRTLFQNLRKCEQVICRWTILPEAGLSFW